MYECMERVLKGDAKAEFLQQANLVGSCTVANFTTVMATMTVHVFPTYAYRDQRRYMQRYLKKPLDMKVRSFTTRLIQLNTYLPYFPPDRPGQLVTSLPDDDIKEILYHAMPNTWKKKMIEQGYNYLDGPIHAMAEFFETRIENLEKSIQVINNNLTKILETSTNIENILQKKCLLTKIMTERAEPAEIWNTVCTRRCARVLKLL